jgi:hypothetical protein
MRKPSSTIILAVLLALSWLGFWASGPRAAQEVESRGRPWRYTKAESNEDLAKLGEDGWEAYAVTRTAQGRPTFWLKK